MVSAEKAACLYDKLLSDDGTKDVEIEMNDGTLMAHSVILMAGSDAMRGILTNGAASSGSQKRLSWKEHGRAVGQFFLRLLYTGALDETEWPAQVEADPQDEPPEILKIHIVIEAAPRGVLACAGVYERKHARANGKPVWKQRDGSHCIFSANSSDGNRKVWIVSPTEDYSSSAGFISCYTSKENCCMPDQVSPWRYHDGQAWQNADDTHIIKVSEPERRVPLGLLIGSLVLAKMYLFQDLLTVLLPALENRLCLETFDAISRAAIKADSQPLRLHCVSFAKDDKHGVRELYDADTLSPEVRAELGGMWSSEPPPKRRRL